MLICQTLCYRDAKIKFLFLPLRSSHSSKGHLKKNKTHSTISDSVEVGCNYSGDHREGTGVVSKRISRMHEISQV